MTTSEAGAAARGKVPTRALFISLGALVVPVYGSFFSPEVLAEVEVLLWLLPVLPAFLLAYHRGWPGAALALALGMGVLALTNAGLVMVGRQLPSTPLLLGVMVAFIGICLGVGWTTEALHRERDRERRLALTDELTGLANRRLALRVLDQEFAAARRGRRLSVVSFDIDHFKSFNDDFGHAAGDDALRAVGSVLARTTRQMNLSARMGGEEFLAVLSDTDAVGGAVFAERVRDRLRELNKGRTSLTLSAGVAEFAGRMSGPEELLAEADRALYRAKATGRDRVVRAEAREIGEDAPVGD